MFKNILCLLSLISSLTPISLASQGKEGEKQQLYCKSKEVKKEILSKDSLTYLSIDTSVHSLDEHRMIPPEALKGDMTPFKNVKGTHLLDRIQPYFDWQDGIRQAGLWYFEKASLTAPTTNCAAVSDSERRIQGVNFASQDYLSLSSHPSIKEAAKIAIDDYGVHSAGSPALFGNTKYSLHLEQVIANFLKMQYVALYPTGWGAGFGIIKGLVRPYDHIIMDKLSHACLQEGAFAATANVHQIPHLGNEAVEQKLNEIRTKDRDNAILVITESLFSMDSDSPDLRGLQSICRSHNAFLLVDTAHDLGCIGEKGLGFLEQQDMVGKIDIVMGSFSKTFASNGGFICTNSKAIREYLTFFSGPRAFSNALSPVQTAVIIKAFEIVQSEEGQLLRASMLRNVNYLRDKLIENNFKTKGEPSAIVPVIIGNEGLTRITTRLLADMGIITNIVEFPGVAKDEARLRLQVMANHTFEDIDRLIEGLKKAIPRAKTIMQDIISQEKRTLSAKL
jgi:7-keto-8-aminopelargonate synthetase-like enzyme